MVDSNNDKSGNDGSNNKPPTSPNEARIKAWRENRLNAAEAEKKARLEKAEAERLLRLQQIEAERVARLDALEASRQERISQAELDRELRIETAKKERQETLDAQDKAARDEARRTLPTVDEMDSLRMSLIEQRRSDKQKLIKNLLYWVGLPTLIVSAYLIFFTTRLYESQSVFAVQTNQEGRATPLSGLIGTSLGGNALQDGFMAREYILSPEMMSKMEKESGFMTYFKNKDMDFFTKLSTNSFFGLDEFDYYQKRVKVAVDVQEGVLKIYVQARSPADAEMFSSKILGFSEEWVNQLSQRMRDEQVSLAEKELMTAKGELEFARKKLVDMQIDHRDLDPRQTIASVYASINDLEVKIREADRQRSIFLKANVKEGPIVERLNEQLVALRQQLKDAKTKLVGGGKQSLNQSLSDFEYASTQKDLAQQRWASALTALESSKALAIQQKRYFSLVVPPAASSIPSEPRPFKTILYVLMSFLILYGLLSLLLRGFRSSERS